MTQHPKRIHKHTCPTCAGEWLGNKPVIKQCIFCHYRFDKRKALPKDQRKEAK